MKAYISSLLPSYLDYFINPSGDYFSHFQPSEDNTLVDLEITISSITVGYDSIYIEYPNGNGSFIKVPNNAYHKIEIL